MPRMTAQARNSLELESGCLHFDVCVAPEDARTVYLYEVYSDEAAFELHLQSNHFKQFDADVAALVKDKQIVTYARVFPN